MPGPSGEPAIEPADELDEQDEQVEQDYDDNEEDELEDDRTDDELNDWGDSEDAEEVEAISESDTIDDASSDARAGKLSNRIKEINSKKRGVDLYLDNLISKATGTASKSKEKVEEYAPKLKGGAKKFASGTKTTFGSIDKLGDKYSKKVFSRDMFDGFINFIINKPVMIIVIILFLTAGISLWGIVGFDQIPPDGELETKIQRNIRGDFEVYLPQEHETKKILDDIQEDWSTDFIIVFVETDNALPFDDPQWKNDANITDLDVLREMDRFEREFNPNRGESDPDSKGDDRVEFMLSFSIIVKELNSTPNRFKKAVEIEFENSEYLPDLNMLTGAYSLPNGQDNITRIFEQMPPESRNKVILDSNGDSIYDTGIILIGITQDNQEELVQNMDKFIKNEMKHSKMTLTGPIPMTQSITKRTYEEFMKTLPAAILLVAGILMIFHRTWKIVVITGVPVLCSLAITFGILGGTDVTLTPQVVLIAPILIALGVAYGLYIANRYSDEANIEDKQERIRVAVRTTGKAIFLSALTTAIGFASLMTVSMIPLQVLGFGLSMGIMICYAVTMLVVPSLVMALDYKKKGEIKAKEKIGSVPVRHRKKILVVSIIFVLASVAIIPSVVANMDFVKMAPQDEEVIIKMREYSDKFGGGQQGIILVEGKSAPPDETEVKGSMRDADTLEIIDDFETELNHVENTNVLSIVDFMKMIQPPGVVFDFLDAIIPTNYDTGQFLDMEDYKDYSFWDLITDDTWNFKLPPMEKTFQLMFIDVFYNTLSNEIRAVFINSDYSKTIILVDMPTMDVVRTKEAVNQVDSIVDKHNKYIEISHLTGFAAILVAVNDMLVESAIWSTIIALILVLIVLAVIFKSFKFSAITLAPVCMVVILQPITLIGIGGLGGFINPENPYFSGELNLFTAVIGSIIVGIGIDFGIHMTERIRERGMTEEGVKHGVATSGMAFVEATVTMIGGLCAVFLINIPAIQEFILLVMILLVYSVIGALFILPALYSVIIRSREAKGLKGEFGSRTREREERLKRLERELEELKKERKKYDSDGLPMKASE